MVSGTKKWFPLEANPDVMNDYMVSLGASASRSVVFQDVFGLDDELLAMVPQPVLAVLLLYPITDKNEAMRTTGSFVAPGDALTEGLFYTKQTISNACGTIGILHALLNNYDAIGPVQPGSVLDELHKASPGLSPEAGAAAIEGSTKLEEVQADAAQQGATANQALDAEINLHFVCMVHHKGQCLELDGRKDGPLIVGPCTPETLLQVAAGHIKTYMAMDPESVQFNVVAFGAAPTD